MCAGRRSDDFLSCTLAYRLANHSHRASRFSFGRSRGEVFQNTRDALLANIENNLIALLPRKDRLCLLAACETVGLELGDLICEAGTVTRHAYFPLDGFISLVAVAAGSPGVEVGMIGREGMLGSQMVLGVIHSPEKAIVQGSAPSLRIGASAFRQELALSTALRRSLARYLYVLMAQQAALAACLRFHTISQRLARWLLMSHDRAHSDVFRTTQEFLSYMLGVRRAGVTAAASSLQRAGLIEYTRGNMRVLDRNGLEHASCGCYAEDRKIYIEHLGNAGTCFSSVRPHADPTNPVTPSAGDQVT
jgi:CRP-like cAMP-binding protein